MKHESMIHLLRERFATAIASLAGTRPEETDPLVRPAGDPRFGDYQCNAAMSLAKTLKVKPREVAQRIVAAAQPSLEDIAEPLEIAGAGFVNIRLKSEFLARYLSEIPAPPSEPGAPATGAVAADPRVGRGCAETLRATAQEQGHTYTVAARAKARGSSDRLGIPPAEKPQRVVVEYSQPNIAKQMHVGHLRSTIIGDVFARVLAFEGHEVIRQNHIGDWGTQFGMLIRWYRDHSLPTPHTHADVLAAIENDYQAANARFGADVGFAAEARRAVAELQAGDPTARRVWEQICTLSRQAFTEVYERLGVLLKPEDVRGESFYNEQLPQVVQELRGKLPTRPVGDQSHMGGAWAEVRDDQGAVCVFMYDEQGNPLFKSPLGEILPLIIQKSDEAYLYATTDLAAIRFRLQELRADRIIYVVDARQKLHFEMFFAVARAAGWIPPGVRVEDVEHVTFGSVLGEDRKPLKTRAGGTIKLRELLDEAERRALELLESRDAGTKGRRDEGDGTPSASDGPEAAEPARALTGPERLQIARYVGIGAVKYADLRNDRNSDYVFSWDKALALQGNTAPYLLYAYARIRSIYRKAAERIGSPNAYAPGVQLQLGEPPERALALRLARFREVIDTVATDLEPHVLCGYLYDLAGEFMRFYEGCPVLNAPDEPTRLSRLRLCDLTARTLKLGLGLLGIETIERM